MEPRSHRVEGTMFNFEHCPGMHELRPNPGLTRGVLASLGEGLRAMYADLGTAVTLDQSDLLERLERSKGPEQGRVLQGSR